MLLVFVIVAVFGIFACINILCVVITFCSRWEGTTIGFGRPFFSDHQSPISTLQNVMLYLRIKTSFIIVAKGCFGSEKSKHIPGNSVCIDQVRIFIKIKRIRVFVV